MSLSKYHKVDISTPDIGERPHQPATFPFPQRELGVKTKVKRSFQAAWFSKWNWLHYYEAKDVVYCSICVKAFQKGKFFGGSLDMAFISNGFSNWKDATVKFKAHESSNSHKEAVEQVIRVKNSWGCRPHTRITWASFLVSKEPSLKLLRPAKLQRTNSSSISNCQHSKSAILFLHHINYNINLLLRLRVGTRIIYIYIYLYIGRALHTES